MENVLSDARTHTLSDSPLDYWLPTGLGRKKTRAPDFVHASPGGRV